MDTQQFWNLVEEARSQVPAPDNGYAVARRAGALLALRPAEEIVAAQQVLWNLMADSYRAPLWGAAYLVNGGCSDDGFDYFRGWLITQGRATFDSVITDPDRLAALPAVRACAAGGTDLECEETLTIAWNAYREATGEDLPGDAFTISYPPLDPDWNFDFGDDNRLSQRLPHLAALYSD
ncbi:DUF4240 domain-containing protein [Kitasatospora sp. NPDC091257]|uniref:DUF4240 domain-containing protein n=1 Tax=Kitasatospora sp. NPDC091257 TaxID=3364084 RepID=UPI0038294318